MLTKNCVNQVKWNQLIFFFKTSQARFVRQLHKDFNNATMVLKKGRNKVSGQCWILELHFQRSSALEVTNVENATP